MANWGERLKTIAANAARREQSNVSSNMTLSCSYLGVKTDVGYNEKGRVRKKSTVAFEWHATHPDYHNRTTQEADADNACERGVKMPAFWKSAVGFDADQIVATSAEKLKRQHRLDSCECTLLGCPKSAPLRSIDQPLGVGSCVTLEHHSGARLSYLLAAQVDGDVWWAHRGSLKDVELDGDSPFDPCDLKLVDVLRDALEPGAPLSKRRCPVHARAIELREAARRRREDWELCCAYAAIKAEETRAAKQHRRVDPAVISNTFERSPFNFKNSNIFARC